MNELLTNLLLRKACWIVLYDNAGFAVQRCFWDGTLSPSIDPQTSFYLNRIELQDAEQQPCFCEKLPPQQRALRGQTITWVIEYGVQSDTCNRRFS